jgi:hypothetical protein
VPYVAGRLAVSGLGALGRLGSLRTLLRSLFSEFVAVLPEQACVASREREHRHRLALSGRSIHANQQ